MFSLELIDTAGDSDRKSHAHLLFAINANGLGSWVYAITLEGMLGSAYEPIIFAALHSAKVMLTIGTKPEYFNSVWVKNEWSRFLKIIKKDRSKLLIPCYRDMDAYELPEEFAHLQSQDMSKIGFINDIVRGIKKIINKDAQKQTTAIKESVISASSTSITVAALLERAFMFLEDGDWTSADEYFEKVLDREPKNAQAYLGKLMANLKVKRQEDLKNLDKPFDTDNNYQKVVRFADDDLKTTLKSYIEYINKILLEDTYNR
ncbi:MAG: TIR domain-containing protein, partial [Pseudomonas sp.]|nr:TIR domain-containing protein [Pseudomonas sp.]